jgi:hypothetical protein
MRWRSDSADFVDQPRHGVHRVNSGLRVGGMRGFTQCFNHNFSATTLTNFQV